MIIKHLVIIILFELGSRQSIYTIVICVNLFLLPNGKCSRIIVKSEVITKYTYFDEYDKKENKNGFRIKLASMLR